MQKLEMPLDVIAAMLGNDGELGPACWWIDHMREDKCGKGICSVITRGQEYMCPFFDQKKAPRCCICGGKKSIIMKIISKEIDKRYGRKKKTR